MDDPQNPRPSRAGRVVVVFIGGLVFLVGALIALAAGICTIALGPSMTSGGAYGGAGSGGVWIVLVFGGVPLLVGLGLTFVGVVIIRAGRR